MRDCCRRAEPNFCSTLRLKLSCDQNTLSSHLTHVARCLLAPVRRVRTDLIRAQYSAIPRGLSTSSAWALLFEILLLKVFYTLKFSASTLIWCQTAACRGFICKLITSKTFFLIIPSFLMNICGAEINRLMECYKTEVETCGSSCICAAGWDVTSTAKESTDLWSSAEPAAGVKREELNGCYERLILPVSCEGREGHL